MVAKGYECDLNVVFFITKDDKLNNLHELEFVLAQVKKVSTFYGVKELIIQNINSERDFLENFDRIKVKLGITQVVLALVAEHRFVEIVHGSLINYFLKKYSDMELHLISPDLAFPSYLDNYVKGRKAYLMEEQGELILYYGQKKGSFNGIFFKELATDFDTGILINYLNNNDLEFTVFKVIDGKAIKIIPSSNLTLNDDL